ncbi:MAG: hypothetical protein WAL75_03435 [Terracidiphilus sp.]
MQATTSLPLKAQTAFAMSSSAIDAASLVQDANLESLTIREYGNCIQGFFVGLCLEGVLALCLYGVYHIGHIVR